VTARVEALCEPGEIILPHAVVSSPFIQALFRRRPVRTSLFTAHLKGVDGAVALARIQPKRSGDATARESARGAGAGDVMPGVTPREAARRVRG